MANGTIYKFPFLGVDITIPENLTLRLYTPPPLEIMESKYKFDPKRMVIDFDVYDRAKKKQVNPEVTLRVYFTKAERELAELHGKEPGLAFWNEKGEDARWERITTTHIVKYRAPTWTGSGVSFDGYIEATHTNWGDPPIALGE